MSKPLQARSLVTIDKVLDAAQALMTRDGVGSLTMDRVAQEAGVSKGGVLHHFRSKKALVNAIALRKLKHLQADVDAAQRLRAGDPQAILHGMIDHARATYCGDDNFSRPLLVAAVEHSESMAEFQAMFSEIFDEVRRDTAAPDRASALLFAAIGIQVCRTLGFAPLDPRQADGVFQAIAEMAEALPTPATASG